MAHHNARKFIVKSPEGEIIEGVGVSVFAVERGLRADSFSLLVNGHIEKYRGWTLVDGLKKKDAKAELSIEEKLFRKVMAA